MVAHIYNSSTQTTEAEDHCQYEASSSKLWLYNKILSGKKKNYCSVM